MLSVSAKFSQSIWIGILMKIFIVFILFILGTFYVNVHKYIFYSTFCGYISTFRSPCFTIALYALA